MHNKMGLHGEGPEGPRPKAMVIDVSFFIFLSLLIKSVPIFCINVLPLLMGRLQKNGPPPGKRAASEELGRLWRIGPPSGNLAASRESGCLR